MKKALFAIAGLVCSAALAAPQSIRTITIINHFNDDLSVEVSRNPELLPDINSYFMLKKNQQVTTRVLIGKPNANEAYIRMSPKKDKKKEAFWGVDSENVHGYMDEGIAYSWNNHSLRTVIFCTPKEYKQKGSC